MQVDWITAELTPPEIIANGGTLGYDTGHILKVSPQGEAIQNSATWENIPSHETSVAFKSPDGASLWFSGNPCKWHQGHNLFGSTDAMGLLMATGAKVRQQGGFFPGPETWKGCGFIRPRFTRIDLTRSYRFPSDSYAREWLRHVGSTARVRTGGALMRGTTVTFGKGSSRWEMVCYLKSDELKARGKTHGLPNTLPTKAHKLLTAWAEGVVRFELRLKRLELADSLMQRLTLEQPQAMWSQYFDRIQFNRNAEALHMDMIEETLPNHLAGYLAMWKNGVDLRTRLAKPTFYRARRSLLDSVGIDIATPPPPVGASEPLSVDSGLDDALWDPEPIKRYLFEPDAEILKQYGLL